MQDFASELIDPLDPQYARNRVRVLIVGNENVGKTALIRRVCDERFKEETDNPDRFDSRKLNVLAKVFFDHLYRIEFQEIDSSIFLNTDERTTEENKPVVHEVIPWFDVHCILCCYDVADRSSYEDMKRSMAVLQKKAAPDCEIIIVGLKSDQKVEKQISYEDAEKLAEFHDIPLFETSSKEGVNVSLLLEDVIDCLQEKREAQLEYLREPTEDEVYRDITVPEETEPINQPGVPSLLCWWPFGNRTTN